MHRDRPTLGEQQDDVDLEHRGDLERRCPQEIVKRDGRGELAGEQIQILSRFRALPGGNRLGACPRRQMTGNDSYDSKEEQRDVVFRIRDREGVKRRQKEEVIGQHADEAREQRRPQPAGDRAGQYRGQEHERDVGYCQKFLQDQPQAQCRRDKSGRDQIGFRIEGTIIRCQLDPRQDLLRGFPFSPFGNDMDADITGMADQLMRDGSAQPFGPARAP